MSSHSWPQSSSASAARDPLLWVVDAGLLIAVCLTPFVMGGRIAIGQMIFCGGAALAGAAWSVRQCSTRRQAWVFSPVLLVGLAAVLLVGCQLVPLPGGVLNALAPGLQSMLPGWGIGTDGSGRLGTWSTISLNPQETLSRWGTLAAGCVLLATLLQRVRSRADVKLALRALTTLTAVMSAFAVLQLVTSNGKYYWFYEHPEALTWWDAVGGFTNANQFSEFAVLGLCLVLMWLWLTAFPADETRDVRRDGNSRAPLLILLCALAACLAISLVLSRSRGGIILAGLVVAVFGVSLTRQGRISVMAALVVVGLMVSGLAGGLAIRPDVRRELAGNLLTLDVDKLDKNSGRRRIWEANWDAAQDFPIAGTGLGSHKYVIHRYVTPLHDAREFSHAENSYLNVLTETGWVGLGLLVTLLAFIGRWCVRAARAGKSSDDAAIATAFLAAGIMTCVHAVYDFHWYAPGIVGPLLLLAVSARAWGVPVAEATVAAGSQRRSARSGQASRSSRRSSATIEMPAPSWGTYAATGLLMASAVFVCGAGWWMYQPAMQAQASWDRYLRLSVEHPGRPIDETLSPDELLAERTAAAMRVVKIHPAAARPQSRLALLLVSVFNRRQELTGCPFQLEGLHEAVRHGGFDDLEQLQGWLSKPKIMGANQKLLQVALDRTRRALRACPTLPECYLLLAQTAFIEGATAEDEAAWLTQAMAVGPDAANVRLAYGVHQWNAGSREEALTHFRVAFRISDSARAKLLDFLAHDFTAEQIIAEFEPDLRSLGECAEHYRAAGDTANWELVVDRLIDVHLQAAAEPAADREWHFSTIGELMMQQGRPQDATQLLRHGVEQLPASEKLRRGLAVALLEAGEAEEAYQYLLSLARRHPDDEQLLELVNRASRQRATGAMNSARLDAPESAATAPRR